MSRAGRMPDIARIAMALGEALSRLGATVSVEDLDTWSSIIHECMSGQGRSYHDVHHAFEIGDSSDPIAMIAGLFHDTVYLQVDGSLPPLLQGLVGHDIIDAGESWAIQPSDRPGAIVLAVFGVESGVPCGPSQGVNELLSALLAARLLGSKLSDVVHLEVASCIEATIPFRPASAVSALEARLIAADRDFDLGIRRDELDLAMSRAIALANRDVAGFAVPDPGQFLDQTWKLLPESNASLRSSAYKISAYRMAMQRMAGFLSSLDPGLVFQSFQGTPSDDEIAEWTRRAARNLSVSGRYLNAKLLAATVVEHLATATGGDASICLIMGDLPADDEDTRRLEDFLPDGPVARANDVDDEVLELLVGGRSSTSEFDLVRAPLSGYLYEALGDHGTLSWLDEHCSSPTEGLAALPRPVFTGIVEAAAEIAWVRRERLLALLEA